MPAPKGNEFWKLVKNKTRNKIFESPEELWESACKYFEWVTDNPIEEQKAFCFQGEPVYAIIEKPRAMTVQGLCAFIEITPQTLENYGKAEGYEEFFGIVSKIKDVMFEQKFTGAAANTLNANIIARDLKLSEEVKQTVTTIEYVESDFDDI